MNLFLKKSIISITALIFCAITQAAPLIIPIPDDWPPEGYWPLDNATNPQGTGPLEGIWRYNFDTPILRSS